MVDHRLGPLLVLLLPQEDQLAQEVRVAESVVAVVLEVGVPEVVDGAAPEVGQDVGGVHGFAPAPLVRKVPGEPAGRDGMQPVQAAGGAHAGLVEAGHLGLGRQIADERIDRFEPPGAIGAEVRQGALTEALATEEVTHDLGEPVGGQQLVVAQIDGRALDAGTILHGGCGFRRERGAVEAAAGAGFDFSLVLGDRQLRLGQIEDLPALDAVRSLFRQGTSAARAALDRVTHGAIRLRHHAQRLARMSGLAAGGPITGRAQTLGLGFAQTVGGRWLAAVVGVLDGLFLQRLDLVAQGLAVAAQGGVLGFQRGDLRLQLVQFACELAEHSRRRFGIGSADRQCLVVADHAHNSRRKSGLSG